MKLGTQYILGKELQISQNKANINHAEQNCCSIKITEAENKRRLSDFFFSNCLYALIITKTKVYFHFFGGLTFLYLSQKHLESGKNCLERQTKALCPSPIGLSQQPMAKQPMAKNSEDSPCKNGVRKEYT